MDDAQPGPLPEEEVKSRRDEYSEATRQALVQSALVLFARDGFQSTSLDDVAADARLTKGAIYHHFESKQALFEAVIDELEISVKASIVAAMDGAEDVWHAALSALGEFLNQCLDPVYQRIGFEEGPRALGFQQWWAHGERHELVLIRAMVQALKDDGLVEIDDLDVLSEMLYGAMAGAALAISREANPVAMRDRVFSVMERVLFGLRAPNSGHS
jgi:AcrR family transcriptional regulator